jgi:hypothetical protein
MDWWNDFVDWLSATGTRPVIFSAVVLAVAIIVSGLLAAWIARGTVGGMLKRSDRAQRASAVAALVDAATEASAWNSLSPAEQLLSDRAVGQADILVRLLPIKGAGAAASWASHQLAEMKRSSAASGYQLDPSVAEFRDRLIEWQNKPSRARRIFQDDIERWRYESAAPVATETSAPVASETDTTAPATETAPYATAAAPATEPQSSYTPGPETEAQRVIADVEAINAARTAEQASGSHDDESTDTGSTDTVASDALPTPVSAYGKPTGLPDRN